MGRAVFRYSVQRLAARSESRGSGGSLLVGVHTKAGRGNAGRLETPARPFLENDPGHSDWPQQFTIGESGMIAKASALAVTASSVSSSARQHIRGGFGTTSSM